MTTTADRGDAKTTLNLTPVQVDRAAAVDAQQLARALPIELVDVVQTALEIIAGGGTVTIGSIPKELTTTSAAQMLDISRPTLMKLVKDGSLRAHKVGTHTRIRAEDVIAYRERQRRQRLAELADLQRFEDNLGRTY